MGGLASADVQALVFRTEWLRHEAIADPLPEGIMALSSAVVTSWGLWTAVEGRLGTIFPVVFGTALELDEAGLVAVLVGAVEGLAGAGGE